jgi:mRNA-degrading endonuclease RelE of RelBE toxin-antitoxin system
MRTPFRLEYARSYLDDLESVDPFDIPAIRRAVLVLKHQAAQVARNRRPLRRTLAWCPEASWQIRVGELRVLYRIDDGTVTVLRVKFKGSGTTEEMGR